jgi:hypothetical protein
MLTLCRLVLLLYPAAYRREYAEEMISVLRDAQEAGRNEAFDARARFCAREIGGLLAGGLRAQVLRLTGSCGWIPFRRFDMRPDFRFPRSTVFLMLVILAGVALTIEEARGIEMKYATDAHVIAVWPALPWGLAIVLALVATIVAIVWGILFALQRTGVHRLANLQPWEGE